MVCLQFIRAYISCLPAEPNSYVIVPNLSVPGLLFNLPPWITIRKVTTIQLEPYQRCTRSLNSHLSRTGHKSRNCTSPSAITIMNNWGGDKKGDKIPMYLPVFDSLLGGIMEGEQLESRLPGNGKERKKIKSRIFKSITKNISLCLKTCMSKDNDWW